jgi:hypothetical protein
MLIVGAMNFSVALFLPVGFDHIQSLDSLSIFFCIIGSLSFLSWLQSNKLLSYRKIGGRTSKFYFLKVFTVIYLVIILIVSLQIIPFRLIESRVKDSILDKSLPALDVKAYRDQIWHNKVVLDTSNRYYDKRHANTSDTKASFSSDDWDNSHTFLGIFKRKLSSVEVAEHILLNSGMGVTSYSINKQQHLIKAHYSTDARRSKIKGYFLIYYRNYMETKVPSTVYNEQISFREISRFDSLGRAISPMQVYYYKNPINLNYRYASPNAIHVSLLADRITGSRYDSSVAIQNLEVLDKLLERVESFNGISYEWPILAIVFCLSLTCVLFVTTYFSDVSLFLSGIAAASPLIIIYFFYPTFGRPNYYHPILLTLLIIAMMIWAYIIGNKPTKNVKRVTILLTLGFYTLLVSILLLLNLEPGVLQNLSTLSYFYKERDLFILFMIAIIIYIIPCFYANRMEKMSYLPAG